MSENKSEIEIDKLISDNNKREIANLLLIKKTNKIILKKIINMNELLNDTIELLEKNLILKQKNINDYSLLFNANKKNFEIAMKNLF